MTESINFSKEALSDGDSFLESQNFPSQLLLTILSKALIFFHPVYIRFKVFLIVPISDFLYPQPNCGSWSAGDRHELFPNYIHN